LLVEGIRQAEKQPSFTIIVVKLKAVFAREILEARGGLVALKEELAVKSYIISLIACFNQ